MGRILTYSERCARYADDVLAGRVIAGELIKLACRRFVRDLMHQNSKSFPYIFDAEAGNKACKFVEKMPHIKGEWAKKGLRLSLEDWQCFAIVNIFAWKCSKTIKDADGNTLMTIGTRRFRTVYWEVARKNAKSTIAAAICHASVTTASRKSSASDSASIDHARRCGSSPAASTSTFAFASSDRTTAAQCIARLRSPVRP